MVDIIPVRPLSSCRSSSPTPSLALPPFLPPFMAPPERRLRNICLPFYAYKRKTGEKLMMHGRRPSRHLLLLHSRFLAAQSLGRSRLRRRRASARKPPPQPTPTEPEQKGRHLSRTSSVCKHSLCLLKCFKDVFVLGTSGSFSQLFSRAGERGWGGALHHHNAIISTERGFAATRRVLTWFLEQQVERFACIKIVVQAAHPGYMGRGPEGVGHHFLLRMP